MLIDCKSIAIWRLNCDHSLNVKVTVRATLTVRGFNIAFLFCVREERTGETAGLQCVTIIFYYIMLQYTCNMEKNAL